MNSGAYVLKLGEELKDAKYGIIMTHGRGADGNDMRSIIPMLEIKHAAFQIPQAPYEIMPGRYAWYRHFWNENLFLNLQELDHSFSILDECIKEFTDNGIPLERILLFGHSQGGNLILEYQMSRPKNFKAIIALRSCIIGKTTFDREFADKLPPSTQIILCAGRRDPFIPNRKVDQTKAIMQKLGANVVKHQYEAAHGISRAELVDLRKFLAKNLSI